MRAMGTMYEAIKPATTMLMIALKAAVLPIFMRARRKAMIALTRIEYKGRPVVGWT
jgi:hypothetical protein